MTVFILRMVWPILLRKDSWIDILAMEDLWVCVNVFCFAQYSFKLMVKCQFLCSCSGDWSKGWQFTSALLTQHLLIVWTSIYSRVIKWMNTQSLSHQKDNTLSLYSDCIFSYFVIFTIFLLLYNWNYFFFLSATFLINFPKNILTPSSKCTDITPGDNFRNSCSFIIRENYP